MAVIGLGGPTWSSTRSVTALTGVLRVEDPVEQNLLGPSSESATVVEEPPQPMVFGDDAHLDELWLACEAGSGSACDQLFLQSPVGSDYERFGVSCGERPTVLHCRAEMDEDTTTEPGAEPTSWWRMS
jgi:hypothetical protein